MDEVVVVVLVGLGVLLLGPLLAVLAWIRVGQLERRVAGLEAREREPGPAVTLPVPPPSLQPESPGRPVPAPQAQAAAPTAAAAAPAAAAPVPATAARAIDWEALIGGRWLNRVGLLAVAVGVSYFLKYAIDNEWIGPRGQVALGVLLGAGLVAWSASFVKRGLGYFADGLAGLGAAVLYLSLWAAGSYYRFLSIDLAFVAMIVVTAAMLAIALGRNSQTVAVLAMIGGFLTPWLLSTGRDAQVVLFLYLALHNFALLALARAREWRFLELPAFAFTQIYFWTWYERFYRPEVLLRTAAFAALFFVQFSVLPVIRVRRFAVLRREHGLLVLVNAAAFLGVLHTLLWPESRWTLTVATLALAAFHIGLARAVPARVAADAPARVLFAGLALTFVTLVIPIRLDGPWITIAWAIEAGILAWSGFATRLWYLRAAAYVIFGAVALRLIQDPPQATAFLFNARLATTLVASASAAVAVWLAGRLRDELTRAEPLVVAALAVGANVLMLWALTLEIDLYFQIAPTGAGVTRDMMLARSFTTSLLWTVYATVLVMVGVRMEAAVLRWQGLALFGITTLKVFFIDLSSLRGFYRILSSIALGVLLLVVSFLYQRSLAARRSGGEKPQ